ncbi:uncharacterized protein LOC111745248 [Pteropus vampyrus]|uniref:Uncharacterized protein LOC111745248 n=1 Tax=Pteropus vampyrus TaxID=132908 RepID=A0A6P6CWL8_PTEVA|nr:uncharacterized protein LOC111745248 [Pteropus vampyrus]
MSDSLKVQNVSQILASLALSAALQQHFWRGPARAQSAGAAEPQQPPPRAPGGWPRPRPPAGAGPGRDTAGGRGAPLAPAPSRAGPREPALPALPSAAQGSRRQLGVQRRPPAPAPLLCACAAAPVARIQTDNAPRLSDPPMAGAGRGGRGAAWWAERDPAGLGPPGPRPPSRSCFPVLFFLLQTLKGRAMNIVLTELCGESRAQTLRKDGSPKQVPPALRARPGLEKEYPKRHLCVV